MNFLAHAYLSFGQEKILVGNFIADFVKGKQINDYEDGIMLGILLHREIDYFTDSHALVRESQTLLRPKFGHYSSVITDIFFDYFLSKHWKRYSDIPRTVFIDHTFEILDTYSDIFPDRFAGMYHWMRKDNWLAGYAEVEGIRQTLTGMSRRTKFDSHMEEAHLALLDHESEFDRIFLAFFEELETFARLKLKEIQQAHGRH